MRVFLDANILFSAAKSKGAVRELLHRLILCGHTLVADGYVIGEARRNLERKFPAAMPDLESLIDEVEANLGVNTNLEAGLAPGLPEKDRPFSQPRCTTDASSC
jgi:predicted nucleic acid-binding protein